MNRLLPFRSIWLRPAETIAGVAHENPGYRLFALPIVAGFAAWPTIALFAPEDYEARSGLVLSSLLSFGPILELVQVFVGAWLIRLTGAWLGGRAGLHGIQVAIAWGNVPIAALAVLGLVLALISGIHAALSDAPLAWSQSLLVTVIAWGLFALQVVIVAWSMLIFLRGLAAVQGYSTARAALNALLAWLVAAALIALAVTMLGHADGLPALFIAGFDTLVLADAS